MNGRLEALLHKAVWEYDQTNANLNNNFGPNGFILKDLIKITDPLPAKVNKVICHYMRASGQDKNFLSVGYVREELEPIVHVGPTRVSLSSYLRIMKGKRKPVEEPKIEIGGTFEPLYEYLERVGPKTEESKKDFIQHELKAICHNLENLQAQLGVDDD